MWAITMPRTENSPGESLPGDRCAAPQDSGRAKAEAAIETLQHPLTESDRRIEHKIAIWFAPSLAA